jgi:hypothetical protein
MPIPLIAQVAIASEALPIAAGGYGRTRLTPARRWIIAWCALLLLIDGVAFVAARLYHRNLWVGQVFAPAEGALLFWALSCWQTEPAARTTLRASIPAYLVVWAILLVTTEDRSTFSTVVEPVYMLLGLLGAAFTLVSRSAVETQSLTRQDWFWVCAAVALYTGSNAALSPLGAMLVEHRPDLVIRAFYVKCSLDIIAFITLSLGILCPLPTRSGASSSPPSSA